MKWDKKVVLVGGAFDILHTGHIAHLRQAKSKGEILIVHITGDKRLQEKKKRKPFFSARERAILVSALEDVDYVFVYDGRHYDQHVIDAVRPDVIFFNKEAVGDEVKEYVRKSLRFKGKVVVSGLKKENSSGSVVSKFLKSTGRRMSVRKRSK